MYDNITPSYTPMHVIYSSTLAVNIALFLYYTIEKVNILASLLLEHIYMPSLCHAQLSIKCKVYAKYYNMDEQNDPLLASVLNINWLSKIAAWITRIYLMHCWKNGWKIATHKPVDSTLHKYFNFPICSAHGFSSQCSCQYLQFFSLY